MSIQVALAGNPNCGKTTLFNELTGSRQHVGNWPGVTVDKKEGRYKNNKDVIILDLPGTYSLSPYSAEEIIARDYIVREKPDVVINIVDATSLERNLYLSLQIIETRIPVVIALNMMDEVERRGDRIDVAVLSRILGVPIVPIVARNGKGLSELMETVVDFVKGRKDRSEAFDAPIWAMIEQIENLRFTGSAEPDMDEDLEAAVADMRYRQIEEIVRESIKIAKREQVQSRSDKIDKVLTNRILALPFFAIIMYLLFAITFSDNFLFVPGLLSPGKWLESLVGDAWGVFADLVERWVENASPWLQSLVMDGMIEGIGSVIGFVPLVLVLYLLISFLEDSGYMARVAFVMDRLFRKFGLSGRSFIPLLMGFGCGVPAIMATRTLESEKDRKLTAIVTGFMPCGAKLPIFALFVSVFFADSNQTLITYSIYMVGIVAAILVSLLLNRLVYRAGESNFVMELPHYRLPTMKSVVIHGWEKVRGFAIKAGTVIFISTIVLWLLTNFNMDSFHGKNAQINEDDSIMCEMDDSFLAKGAGVIAPLFQPLGFGEWRPVVGVVVGWTAKEMVVAAMAQLYKDGGTLSSIQNDIPNKAAAYSYMVFNLLCMPCFAAVGAMRRELKTWKMTGFAIGIQMLTAYIAALFVNLF